MGTEKKEPEITDEPTRVYLGTAGGLAVGLIAGGVLMASLFKKTASGWLLLIPLAAGTFGALYGRKLGKKWEASKNKPKK